MDYIENLKRITQSRMLDEYDGSHPVEITEEDVKSFK